MPRTPPSQLQQQQQQQQQRQSSSTNAPISTSPQTHFRRSLSPAFQPESAASLFEGVFQPVRRSWKLEPLSTGTDAEAADDEVSEGQRQRRLRKSLSGTSLDRTPRTKPWWELFDEESISQEFSGELDEKYDKLPTVAYPRRSKWKGLKNLLRHLALQHVAFVIFVLLSANDTIVKSLSKRRLDGPEEPRDFPYAFSSVLVVAGCLSVTLGSVLALWFHGLSGLKRCWNVAAILRMTPLSFMFQLATILKFVSLKYVPPDMVTLLSQMQLILLAVTMRFVLGKKYSPSQWISLALTSLAMFQYLTIRDGRHKGQVNVSLGQLSDNVSEGMLVLFGMCFLETLASTFAEKFFKERTSPEPFYIQKVHIDFSGLVLALFWCYILEPFVLNDLEWSCKPQRCRQVVDVGLLAGWDWQTVAVLGIVIGKMWFSALVAKVLDSVVKQLGSCLSMVLTYLEVVYLDSDARFEFDTVVALSVVVMAICSFAVSTRDSRKLEQLGNASTTSLLPASMVGRKSLRRRTSGGTTGATASAAASSSTTDDVSWVRAYQKLGPPGPQSQTPTAAAAASAPSGQYSNFPGPPPGVSDSSVGRAAAAKAAFAQTRFAPGPTLKSALVAAQRPPPSGQYGGLGPLSSSAPGGLTGLPQPQQAPPTRRGVNLRLTQNDIPGHGSNTRNPVRGQTPESCGNMAGASVGSGADVAAGEPWSHSPV